MLTTTQNSDLQVSLVRDGDSKNTISRLARFERWILHNGLTMLQPDLTVYRDELLKTLKPSSVRVHLSTIRGRYTNLRQTNDYRDYLFLIANQAATKDWTPADIKAFADEIDTRLVNAINSKNSRVKVTTKQDVTDNEQLRLTPNQVTALLDKIDVTTIKGLRDAALIALAVCTGLREGELVDLVVNDLRQTVDSILGVLVRQGKGDKQRFVPYGSLDACLVIVDKWLQVANIESGLVFRSITKGGKVKDGGLQTRDIERMLKRTTTIIDGELRSVRAHDLRRTYAKNLYQSGTDIVAIQQNLGHANMATTLHYIGDVDMDKRKPGQVFDLNLERFM